MHKCIIKVLQGENRQQTSGMCCYYYIIFI